MDFGFYFGSGSYIYDTYDLVINGSDSYQMTDSNTNMTVLVHDANPVPEPSTLMLLGAGLVSVGLYRWRRMKK